MMIDNGYIVSPNHRACARHQVLAELREMFYRLDHDGSGEVSRSSPARGWSLPGAMKDGVYNGLWAMI